MLLFEALARLGGRLRLPGALRRWPRFARLGLASLGLAELRKWLSSAGTPKVAVLERKMQSDDGKMMKFMISFGAL